MVGRAWAGGAARVVAGGGWAWAGRVVAGGAVVGVVSGGNCSIRGATRRRHAVAVRLVVQNPRWAAGCGPVGEVAVGRGALWLGVGGWVGRWRRAGPWLGRVVAGCSWRGSPAGPWLARANGGNCSIRGATRRRHAVAMRLMVQNPPLSGPVSGGWAGRRPGVAGPAGRTVAGEPWTHPTRAVSAARI